MAGDEVCEFGEVTGDDAYRVISSSGSRKAGDEIHPNELKWTLRNRQWSE